MGLVTSLERICRGPITRTVGVTRRTYARIVAGAERDSWAFAWLTGLLEAEGTFLNPPPSSPGQPVVRCSMTDRDVIERVAEMFGTGVAAIDRPRCRTAFATSVRGSRAAALMKDSRPGMSTRRTAAIDSALSRHVPPSRKLSFEKAETIRAEHRNGRTISSLAREYGVRPSTIRPLLQRRIYRSPPPRPWRTAPTWMPSSIATALEIPVPEFCWLAGWLEGEGSFGRPPPSTPRRPRVYGTSCDRDVIDRVAHSVRIRPGLCHDPRGVARGWSPAWKVLKQGGAAVELMRALRPLMGKRRAEQIDAALEFMETRGIEPLCTVA